ncbi:MAG: CARDB domain-containing protein [candidate division WOR-3 bacterium]
MRKAVALTLLLLAVVALAIAPKPPAINPETGEPVGPVIPHQLTGKTPLPPSQAYVEWQNSQAPWAETDAQWQDTVRLTNNSVTDYASYQGHEAVGVDPSGRVHVVWMSYQTPGTYSPQVYYKRYYPGSGWTTDTCISGDVASTGYSYYPALAIDSSGNVHVVWYHYKVASAPTGYYIAYKMCTPTSSGNGGWSATQRITEDTLLWYKYYPSIACTPNGNVHVAYYCYYSTLGYCVGYKEKVGSTWQARQWVDSTSTSYYHYWVDIAGGRDNNVHVVWYGYQPSNTSYYQIWYRGRFSGTWGAIQNVSKWGYYCYYPTIAVDPRDNVPAVVYYTYTLPNYWYLLAFKKRLGAASTDTWPDAYENVLGADTTLYAYMPCLVYSKEGRAHVVWNGYPSSGNYYYAVRYNSRSPAGTWDAPYTICYVPSYYQYYPSMNNGGNGEDSLAVHVTWTGTHPGNYEIYYAKGLPPSPYDLAMHRITLPSGLHEVGENVNPSVWVKNVGTASVSSFSVKLDIGSSYSSTVTVNQTLAPGDTYNVTGFSTWTPSTSGSYAVRCSVQLSGDGNNANDRITQTTLVADFVERFDVANGNFRGTGGWSWGQPQSPRTPPPSTPNCWGDVLSGYYQNSANDTLLSFNLVATADTPVVMFMHWMYCETYYDGGNFKYSTDGGQTWTLLNPDGTRAYYGYVYGLGENGYSGSWDWEVARFKIPVANGTSFKVHWRFGSDGSVVYYGWLIDNVAGIGCRKPVDVGATEILAPTGSIPYGVAVTPQAKVWNFGSGTQSFPVEFRIGSVYADTQAVSSLAPGESAIVSFTPWTPTAKGSYATSATTLLSSDEVPDNNTVTGSVDVYLVDVQPTAIVRPVGEVDSGAVIAPQVRVRNNGSSTVSFYVQLQIGSSYNQQRLVVGLTPDEERLITGFPNWVANELGDFEVRCTTRLTGDMITANDLLTDSVHIHKFDVATTQITVPSGNLSRGAVITPTAKYANYGDQAADVDVHYLIYDETMTAVYDQTEQLTLDPGAEVEHAFSTPWTAANTGSYLAVAYIVSARDNNHANDTAQFAFIVRVPYDPGWKEMASILGEVKDGGFVVKDPDGGKLYAARGYKSGDFYVYDIETNTWSALPAAPAIIGKGGNGCYGNGYVYVMHGQNSAKFSRFSIADNSWEALPDIPAWTSGKNPKGGGDLAYAEVDGVPYVYVLKGYKQDFGRYNLVTGTWEELTQAPAGAKPKWDKGSWLVYDGATTLYAHKAKYSELWTYDLAGGAWSAAALPGIPYPSTKTGKNKKPKDGSDGVYYNGFLYALKGGNTCEFWKYDISGGTGWTELDIIPEVGTTGKKKRVKNGGSLASNGDGAFFALKGGKTMEFWRYYEEPAPLASAPERSGVMGQTVTPARFGFALTPNPLVKGYGLLSYSVPQAGAARVKVFDVTGRTVAEFGFVAQGTGTRSLDLRQLSAGIYLVKFEAAGQSASQKLIVQ